MNKNKSKEVTLIRAQAKLQQGKLKNIGEEAQKEKTSILKEGRKCKEGRKNIHIKSKTIIKLNGWVGKRGVQQR